MPPLFRWVTMAALLSAAFLGCGESAGSKESLVEAGKGASGTGGTPEGGDGGAEQGAVGGGAAASEGGSSGNAGGSGGAAGTGGGMTAGLGGAAGLGGTAGSAGTGVGAGAGGLAQVPLPIEWHCGPERYGDGKTCDCGCGAVDSDCDDESVESCDVCQTFGSCGNGVCPSNVVKDDNTRCSVAPRWWCGEALYGDGYCDCGCGDTDIDCDGTKLADCDFCPRAGCVTEGCDSIDPEDNANCATPAPYWQCPARLYNDGSQCDCGCGAKDPDCGEFELDACNKCNDEGSCSGQACPGTIDPNAIEHCIQPDPPEDWTCDAYCYADGFACDCGCGVVDADCRTPEPESCEECSACGFGACSAVLSSADPTQCAPPPVAWFCTLNAYRDAYCDCGCGALDPACGDVTSLYCGNCNGCSHGHCERIDEMDNSQCNFQVPADWTCGAINFYDGVCDCGCGALDADCLSAQSSDCDSCSLEGSCSEVSCTDPESTIEPNDNTSCTD